MLTVDHSNHPVVIMRVSGRRTLQDNNGYLDCVDQLLDRGERFSLVTVDLSTTSRTNTEQAKRAMSWVVWGRGHWSRLCAGLALVCTADNEARKHRFINTAGWMLSIPTEVFLTESAALAWGRAKITGCH